MAYPEVVGAVEWEVYNPTAEREELAEAEAPRLAEFVDKRIGLFWNGKPGGDVVLDVVAELLQERFARIRFEKFDLYLGVDDEHIQRMATCDALVSAIGD